MVLFNKKFFKYLLDKDYELRNYKKRTMRNLEEYKQFCIDNSCNISWKDYINDISYSIINNKIV
jgi:hypothetical protein